MKTISKSELLKIFSHCVAHEPEYKNSLNELKYNNEKKMHYLNLSKKITLFLYALPLLIFLSYFTSISFPIFLMIISLLILVSLFFSISCDERAAHYSKNVKNIKKRIVVTFFESELFEEQNIVLVDVESMLVDYNNNVDKSITTELERLLD